MDAPKWLRKYLPDPAKLRDSFIHSVLGERIFAREVWIFTRRSMPGGIALGLFFGFLPVIPFQMLLAATGAVILGVNLPLALLATWVSNPVTIYPVYMAAMRVGEMMLRVLPLPTGEEGGVAGHFMVRSVHLWTGSIVFASLAALAGNLIVKGIWRYATVKAWNLRKLRNKAKRR